MRATRGARATKVSASARRESSRSRARGRRIATAPARCIQNVRAGADWRRRTPSRANRSAAARPCRAASPASSSARAPPWSSAPELALRRTPKVVVYSRRRTSPRRVGSAGCACCGGSPGRRPWRPAKRGAPRVGKCRSKRSSTRLERARERAKEREREARAPTRGSSLQERASPSRVMSEERRGTTEKGTPRRARCGGSRVAPPRDGVTEAIIVSLGSSRGGTRSASAASVALRARASSTARSFFASANSSRSFTVRCDARACGYTAGGEHDLARRDDTKKRRPPPTKRRGASPTMRRGREKK